MLKGFFGAGFLFFCLALGAQETLAWNDFGQWKASGGERKIASGELTLLRNETKGFCQAAAPSVFFREKKDRQLILNAEMRVHDASAILLVTGYGADKKIRLWKIIRNLKGTTEWEAFRQAVLVPAEVRGISLACRINSAGGAVSLRKVSAEIRGMEHPEPGLELFRTVWLGTKNDRLPSGWRNYYQPGNESIYEIRPSSGGIVLAYQGGTARFGVEGDTLLPALPGGTVLRFSGRYKTSGKGRAALMAVFYGKGNSKLAEELSPAGSSASWNWIRHDFTVPAGTERMTFALLNIGTGQVVYLEAGLKTVPRSENKAEYPVRVFASPLEGNRIIHDGKYLFHTLEDSPSSLSFDFWGERAKTRDTALVLEVEKGLRVAGCYSSHPTVYRDEKPECSEILRGGVTFRRYAFRNPAAFRLIGATRQWCRQVVAAFEPEEKNGKQRDFQAYFYLDGPAGKSEERGFTVRVLPPMEQLPNPRKFRYYAWGDHDLSFPDQALFLKVIRKYEEAGLISRQRSTVPGLLRLDGILEKRGWNMHVPLQDYTQRRIMGRIVETLPDKRYAVDYAGKISAHHICPEYYTDSMLFRKALESTLAERFRQCRSRSGDWVFMDYEPWATMDSCYCEVCLGKFDRTLKSGARPSPAEIRKNYRAEWAAYRSDQSARVNRLTVNLVRKYNPDLIVTDYDYPVPFDKPGFERMFTNICKDPRLYEDCIAAHFQSFYHTHRKAAFDMIDVNIRHLKKPVFITPAISRNDIFQGSYTTDEETLSPRRFRQMVLAAATAGAQGVCIYPGNQIDGAFFPAVNRASYEIALFEDCFLKGERAEKEWKLECRPNRIFHLKDRRIELPRWSDFSGFRVHRFRNETLISLFNFNPREILYASIRPAGTLPGKIAVYDPVRKERITAKGGKLFTAEELSRLCFKIDPEDVLFLKIVPENALPSGLRERDLSSNETEYNDLLRKNSGASFQTVKWKGSEAFMTDADQDGRPEISLKTPLHTAQISLCGGVVQQWNVRGIPFCNTAETPLLRGLLWDFLLIPMTKYTLSDSNYTLESIRTAGDSFLITLKHIFEVKKLELVKQITFPLNQPRITADYRIRNIGSEPVEVSFWSHNYPAPGNPADPLSALEFRIGEKIIGKLPQEQICSYRGAKVLFFRKNDGNVAENVCVVRNTGTGSSLLLSCDAALLNQFYFWRGTVPSAEFMSRAVRLAPGETFRMTAGLEARSGK